MMKYGPWQPGMQGMQCLVKWNATGTSNNFVLMYPLIHISCSKMSFSEQ